jgi:hypothetical protein
MDFEFDDSMDMFGFGGDFESELCTPGVVAQTTYVSSTSGAAVTVVPATITT